MARHKIEKESNLDQQMRNYIAAVTLLLSAPLAHAQQAGSWSGFYAAGFGQYSGGASKQRDNGYAYAPVAVAPLPLPADGGYGLSGGFAGGGIGYNIQFDRIVLGANGDIAGGTTSGSSGFCGTPSHVCGTRVNAMSDVRGLVGYSFGKFLPFVTGGLAIDHIQASDALFGANGSAWRPGYVIGGGLSYKITPQLALTLTLEYLHSEINSASLFNIVPGVPERISVRSETARVSLNYFLSGFAPEPVVARY